MSFLVDGEFLSRSRTTAAAFSRPRRDSLDMRRRLPGLWGRFGGIVAVDADRLVRGFEVPIRLSGRSEKDRGRRECQEQTDKLHVFLLVVWQTYMD